MIEGKRILFHLQAGSHIGGGHLARCLTLANALAAKGAHITFRCNEEAWEFQNLRSSLYKKYNATTPLQSKFDLAIIDDYSMKAEDDRKLRDFADKIMVIDDLANRTHDCDILLDFSPSRVAEDYKKLIQNPCTFFTGIDYIILRPEFFELCKTARKDNELKTIFLTMGSIDGARMLPKVLDALEKAEDKYVIHIMITSKTKTLEDVKRFHKSTKHKLLIHKNLKNPAQLMHLCDLAITAGGMTSLELVSLGVPTLAIIVADNQIENVTTLDQRNLAKKINDPKEILPAIVAIKSGTLKFEKLSIGKNLKIVTELERILS